MNNVNCANGNNIPDFDLNQRISLVGMPIDKFMKSHKVKSKGNPRTKVYC